MTYKVIKAIDLVCKEMVGHTNWDFVDEVIQSEPIQCGVGEEENVVHLIAIFKEPLEEEKDDG